MKDKRNAKLHSCDLNNQLVSQHVESKPVKMDDTQSVQLSNESLHNNPDESEYQHEADKKSENQESSISTETMANLLSKLETSSFAKVNNNDADDFMCNRMSYSAMQSKQAINNRAKYHKHSLNPYFDSELRANEERDWWDRETDYLDLYM